MAGICWLHGQILSAGCQAGGCFEQFGKSDHSVQRGTQLMAHVDQELAFGLTGGFRLFFRQLQGFFNRFAVGDILYVTVPKDISISQPLGRGYTFNPDGRPVRQG